MYNSLTEGSYKKGGKLSQDQKVLTKRINTLKVIYNQIICIYGELPENKYLKELKEIIKDLEKERGLECL